MKEPLVNPIQTPVDAASLFDFMSETIVAKEDMAKWRTAEAYRSALRSFQQFRKAADIPLPEIDSRLMAAYEAWLGSHGLCPNSRSFYLRILRAVYNRAVEQGLTPQRFPFKYTYTGVERTHKRAIELSTMRKIKELELRNGSTLELARDMFLFSFYTRGMAFVDMAYLRKQDLRGDTLYYRRQKTGQQMMVHWETQMQAVVDKYAVPSSPFLLPIIHTQGQDERKQYLYASHNINRSLKKIGKQLNLPAPLTMYVARHAWASIARSKNVPLSVISEGMGHDSEATTRIYLATLDAIAVDNANRLILNSI